jgi:hypothetical protein
MSRKEFRQSNQKIFDIYALLLTINFIANQDDLLGGAAANPHKRNGE